MVCNLKYDKYDYVYSYIRNLPTSKVQKNIINKFCYENKILYPTQYCDNNSKTRNEFYKMIDDINLLPISKNHGTAIILVTEVSKFSRKRIIKIIEKLTKKKIEVYSIIENCGSIYNYEYFINLLSHAEEESKTISKRLRVYNNTRISKFAEEFLKLLKINKVVVYHNLCSASTLFKIYTNPLIMNYLYNLYKPQFIKLFKEYNSPNNNMFLIPILPYSFHNGDTRGIKCKNIYFHKFISCMKSHYG